MVWVETVEGAVVGACWWRLVPTASDSGAKDKGRHVRNSTFDLTLLPLQIITKQSYPFQPRAPPERDVDLKLGLRWCLMAKVIELKVLGWGPSFLEIWRFRRVGPIGIE